jgi:caffeoyl-CoA O-methyltransferase
MMFNIIDPFIEEYCVKHSDEESPLLYSLNRKTHLQNLNPRMLSGHLQGRILSMYSLLIKPKVILEIGTFTGYSALCLSEGLAEDGILYTLDVNEEIEEIACEYFNKSEKAQQIKLHIGDAIKFIENFNHPIDLVFIDADKKNYVHYFKLVADKIRSGGLLIADNVLWSGKVINQDTKDPDTLTIREFNKTVAQDSRFKKLILPVRDGLTVAYKL